MILREDDKLGGREVSRRTSVLSFSERRILTAVNKSLAKSLDQLPDVAKILIISIAFSCQESVETMVKIIIPLGI
jgi:hypothetical protein